MSVRPSRRSPRSIAVVVPLALALAGCGSTALRGSAPVSGGGTAVDGSSTGLVAPGTGRPLATSTLTGGPSAAEGAGTSTSGATPTGGTTSSTTAGTGGAGTATGSASGGSLVPGPVSKAPIKMGVAVTDAGALGAIFGVKHTDPTLGAKSVIAGLNRAGGIGGRQIAPVFYTADSSADASSVGQAACTAFTQDDKVDIVMGAVITDVLPSCLAQRGIAYFDPGTVAPDPQQAKRHPNWFQPSAMRLDRSVRGTLEVGASRGILKQGSKLGVLVEDCPAYNSIVTSTVLPMVKALGVKVTQGSFRCVTNLVGDLVPVTTDVQRETLRFSTAGVNSIIVVSPTEAFALSNLTKTASQQKFYPKYLVGSNANTYGNSQSDAIVSISPDALPNIVGAGYLPFIDVGDQAKPATSAQRAEQARCDKIDPTQGGAASAEGSGRYFKRNGFYAFCEAFLVMKASLEADGMRFGYTDVARGFASVLSSGAASALLAGGRYGGGAAGRLDGAGLRPAVQLRRFSQGLQVLRSTGRGALRRPPAEVGVAGAVPSPSRD